MTEKIDVSDVRMPSGLDIILNESQIAHKTLETFARIAEKATGWKDFRVHSVGLHDTKVSYQNPDGIEATATVEATSPRGQTYTTAVTMSCETLDQIRDQEGREYRQNHPEEFVEEEFEDYEAIMGY